MGCGSDNNKIVQARVSFGVIRLVINYTLLLQSSAEAWVILKEGWGCIIQEGGGQLNYTSIRNKQTHTPSLLSNYYYQVLKYICNFIAIRFRGTADSGWSCADPPVCNSPSRQRKPLSRSSSSLGQQLPWSPSQYSWPMSGECRNYRI